MTIIYLNSRNFAMHHDLPDTYFIVQEEITLGAKQYVLGKGSVVEFIGGCLKGVSGSSFDINGGSVIAAPYPIFVNLEVCGFSNSKVYVEWFTTKDQVSSDDINQGSSDDINPVSSDDINKALIAARGCPVILSNKEYKLTGTIVFPNDTPSTLIAYGSLLIERTDDFYTKQENPVAIDINASNVNLDINKIEFPGEIISYEDEEGKLHYETIPEKGTAIRLSGEVRDITINVNSILHPKYGIDISPGGRYPASLKPRYGNMQFLNINFQDIYAVYGIYIDIFSNGEATLNSLKRSSFHGGRLRCDYGLYIDDAKCPANFDNTHISEMSFSNIGFEGIAKQSIHLRNASYLKFEFIRMAESQPEEGYWIDLKDVSFVSFTINGDLYVDKYHATGICDNVLIKGAVFYDRKWTTTPFDVIVIDTLRIKRSSTIYPFLLKTATSTVNPYQMTQVTDESSDLQQIQPTAIPAVIGEYEGLKVLPRMLQFKISSDTTIELTGIQNYAPCIFFISLEKTSGNLTLKSSQAPFLRTSFMSNQMYFVFNDTNTRLTIKQAGTYQFMHLVVDGNWRTMVLPICKK